MTDWKDPDDLWDWDCLDDDEKLEDHEARMRRLEMSHDNLLDRYNRLSHNFYSLFWIFIGIVILKALGIIG